MNRKEQTQIIRDNIPFYLTGLALILSMKYFYSRAGASQLLWLLAPTAGWVSLLSGIPFEYVHDIGYVNHGMKIIIAPSCSGMQFMLITAAMLIFSFVHLSGSLFRQSPRAEASKTARNDYSPKQDRTDKLPACGCPGRNTSPSQGLALSTHPIFLKGFAWLCFSLLLSCPFTIFVNGLRIITAIYLPLLFERLCLFGDSLTPDSLHTAIGTLVYFAALLTLYRLTANLFHRKTEISLFRRCLPPVFWYFAIVLGIPFLNRAYERNGEQFTGFAVLVSSCCGGILLLYCAGLLLWKFRRTGR